MRKSLSREQSYDVWDDCNCWFFIFTKVFFTSIILKSRPVIIWHFYVTEHRKASSNFYFFTYFFFIFSLFLFFLRSSSNFCLIWILMKKPQYYRTRWPEPPYFTVFVFDILLRSLSCFSIKNFFMYNSNFLFLSHLQLIAQILCFRRNSLDVIKSYLMFYAFDLSIKIFTSNISKR